MLAFGYDFRDGGWVRVSSLGRVLTADENAAIDNCEKEKARKAKPKRHEPVLERPNFERFEERMS